MNPAPMPLYSRRRTLLFYIVALAAYALLFTFWQAEPVPWNVHLLAIVVAATCFLPLARWYARGSQGLPMFELICLSYALQFSMPVYTQPNWLMIRSQQVPLRWDTTFEVLLLAELGILAMIGGYAMLRRARVSQAMPRLDLPLLPQRRALYLWGALVGGGLLTLLQVLGWGFLGGSAFGALVRLFMSQFNVAIVLLAYAVYEAKWQGAPARIALYGAVAFGFVVGLMTGMLENTLMPLVLVLAVRWHATRRVPWFAILAGFAIYVVLNPAKFEYRRQVWFGGQEVGVSQRLEVWALAVEDELSATRQQETWEESLREALARFDLVHRFTYVREMTPAYLPFYGGVSYSYFLYAWIPRILWPDKPSASESTDLLDIEYGLKYEGQAVTVGIGQLPEAYANFGVAGIAVVMALQGVAFALLDAMLNGPRSEGGRAIYLVIMAYFLNGIGSSAAVLFGALVQYVLASAVIMRPFAASWQAGRPAQQDNVPDLTGSGQGSPARATYEDTRALGSGLVERRDPSRG
jgi:hypothetical protein